MIWYYRTQHENKSFLVTLFYLLSEIRFSAFAEELARDSDKTFNLSTCLYNRNSVGNRSFHNTERLKGKGHFYGCMINKSKDQVAHKLENIKRLLKYKNSSSHKAEITSNYTTNAKGKGISWNIINTNFPIKLCEKSVQTYACIT